MGNIFSNKQSDDFNKLIFDIIDKNKDNNVSKDEFNEWNNIMHNKINKINNKNKIIIKQFEQTITDKDLEIEKLKLYIKSIEEDKEELIINNQQLVTNLKNNNHDQNIKSIISKSKVREYVKKILKDENINIKHLPDSIEESIYTNVIYIVMNMIGNVTDSAQMNLLNHNFRIIIN